MSINMVQNISFVVYGHQILSSSSSQWNSYGPISYSQRSIPGWLKLPFLWLISSKLWYAHNCHNCAIIIIIIVHHCHRLHDVTVHPLVPRYQSQSAEPRGKISLQADNAKPQLWFIIWIAFQQTVVAILITSITVVIIVMIAINTKAQPQLWMAFQQKGISVIMQQEPQHRLE